MEAKATVRSAVGADCAAIADIYNYYVLHDTCTYQEIPDLIEHREKWFEDHGPRHPVIVAEAEGRVVGWASLSPYHKRSAYRFTVENSIYLHPDWRQRGLGSLLLRELIDRAKALGHRTIIAVISAEQTGSLKIHEKCGFVKVGHFKGIGFKFSQWLDVVYLQLELKP
jgi:phosphinothricin acetyltransferase